MILSKKDSPKNVAFYAYVLGCIVDVQWTTDHIRNPESYSKVKQYLTYLYGTDEWRKMGILNAIRDKSRKQIKDEARRMLPSLFTGRSTWPLAVPKEAPDVKFDIEFISKLRGVQIMNSQNNEVPVQQKAPKFLVPETVDLSQLTLNNFRELTGHRFRVTTEQQNRIKAGTLTREQAFVEFMAELNEGAV